jgi:hypothetical protein
VAPRLVRDPGKVLLGVGVAVALGGDCLSDFAAMRGLRGIDYSSMLDSVTFTSEEWQKALADYTALLPRLRDSADDAAALGEARDECVATWARIEQLLEERQKEIRPAKRGEPS